MEHFSDEQIGAYLDGEAPEDLRVRLEDRLAVDPELQARVARLRKLAQLLESSFQGGDDKAEALAILDRARADARAQGQDRIQVAPRRRLMGDIDYRLPLAACLAFATGAGLTWALVLGTGSQPDSLSGNTVLIGSLSKDSPEFFALNRTSSGTRTTLPDGRVMTPVLTFRSRTGELCREFDLKSAQSKAAGVACIRNGDWAIAAVAAVPSSENGTSFAPASGMGDDLVSRYVTEHMAGSPLAGEEEASLLADNWTLR